MTSKMFLTISSIVAILYGLSFLLAPAQSIAAFGAEPEPHLVLVVRFLGSALISFGIVQWLGRDFRDWEAIRAVLIGLVVVNVVNVLLNLWGAAEGLLNSTVWVNIVINAVFSAGGLYCLSSGARRPAQL